jgi:hypothetical protein
MEKIEKNFIDVPRKGKSLIRASQILEITLQDYHDSRSMYGENSIKSSKVSNK